MGSGNILLHRVALMKMRKAVGAPPSRSEFEATKKVFNSTDDESGTKGGIA